MNIRLLRAAMVTLVFACCAFSQTKPRSVSYVFPEKSSEYVVTFPTKPIVETIFGASKSGLNAKLSIQDGALKAEVLEISKAEADGIERMTETMLASAANAHGKDNGYESLTVATGRSALGRYARMQGYKTIDNERLRFEALFQYGKHQVIILYVVCESSKYPTSYITQFFNSLKFSR